MLCSLLKYTEAPEICSLKKEQRCCFVLEPWQPLSSRVAHPPLPTTPAAKEKSVSPLPRLRFLIAGPARLSSDVHLQEKQITTWSTSINAGKGLRTSSERRWGGHTGTEWTPALLECVWTRTCDKEAEFENGIMLLSHFSSARVHWFTHLRCTD